MKELLKKIIEFILKTEARLILKKYKPKIIAISGTVGKTSTKEAIATVLSGFVNVRKSEKSYNSQWGVPLTIIDAQSGWDSPLLWTLNIIKGAKLILFKNHYPEWLILELGVGKPGDMKNVLSWVKPNIAIMTALSKTPVHVEYFKSPEEIIKEKSLLLTQLGEADTAILNEDDPLVFELKEKVKAKTVTYGFAQGSDMLASNYKMSQDGILFKIDYKGVVVPVRLNGCLGKQNVYSALAAIAVGNVLGLNFVEMEEALLKYDSPPGRVKLLEGVKKTFVIDDTYNSSPIAQRAAFEILNELPSKRKIAVLGDMLELGKLTIDEHKKAGKEVAEVADLFFAVGPRMRFAAEEARAQGMNGAKVFEFSTADEAKVALQEKLKEGDLVLVKGSQSMRMEKVVEEVMAHPELKEKLLVRREEEWKKR